MANLSTSKMISAVEGKSCVFLMVSEYCDFQDMMNWYSENFAIIKRK